MKALRVRKEQRHGATDGRDKQMRQREARCEEMKCTEKRRIMRDERKMC